MVSGFFTSPYDHERIFSGEASPILIASNSSSCVTCLNKSSSAFIYVSDVLTHSETQVPGHRNHSDHRGHREEPFHGKSHFLCSPCPLWSLGPLSLSTSRGRCRSQ